MLMVQMDIAASFSKRCATLGTTIKFAHTGSHALKNNECVYTHLHAAPACLRHCHAEEK